MSTSDSIVSSQTKQSSWRKSDTTWTLGLFGTAIGAGVLFFPIRAGFGGLIPILLMLVLAYPIAFYCHRALARLCLSGSNPSGNITETVEEHFGKTGGVVITFLYFFAICPLLWIYGVTITNTFMTFWENQLGFAGGHFDLVSNISRVAAAQRKRCKQRSGNYAQSFFHHRITPSFQRPEFTEFF